MTGVPALRAAWSSARILARIAGWVKDSSFARAAGLPKTVRAITSRSGVPSRSNTRPPKVVRRSKRTAGVSSTSRAIRSASMTIPSPSREHPRDGRFPEAIPP